PAGNGQRGVVAQRLADVAAGVAGKAQAIVLRRNLRAVVGDIPVVVHDEVVAQPRFTLDRQVVGDDAVAVDVGVADGDAVADLDVVSQFERQVRAGTGDLDVAVAAAEIHRTTGRHVGARAALGADVRALADVGQRVLHIVVGIAAHRQVGSDLVGGGVVRRSATQRARHALAGGIQIAGQRFQRHVGAVQLAAVDGVGAGRVDAAGGDIGDGAFGTRRAYADGRHRGGAGEVVGVLVHRDARGAHRRCRGGTAA